MATRTRRTRTSASKSEPTEGRLDRDYSDEEYREPGEGYQDEQPTKGLYTCKLVEIKNHETAEGSESIRWAFELMAGSENKNGDDVSGWRDYQYTNDSTTLWREQQIAVALGLAKPGGALKGTFAALVKKAKPCTVRVGVERYIPEDGDGEGEWRGRMQAFMPLKDGATKTRRAKDDDEDLDDLEDDADETDEDDEEETKPARRTTSRSRRKAAEPEPEDEDEEGDGDGDEDEDEPYDPDELAAELEDMTLVALKKRARDEFGIKITRGMKAEDIVEAILETLEDEDEPEEEPEPPKRTRRAVGTKRKTRGGSDDVPF